MLALTRYWVSTTEDHNPWTSASMQATKYALGTTSVTQATKTDARRFVTKAAYLRTMHKASAAATQLHDGEMIRQRHRRPSKCPEYCYSQDARQPWVQSARRLNQIP